MLPLLLAVVAVAGESSVFRLVGRSLLLVLVCPVVLGVVDEVFEMAIKELTTVMFIEFSLGDLLFSGKNTAWCLNKTIFKR